MKKLISTIGMTEEQYINLKNFLFHDQMENFAILLCGKSNFGNYHTLSVYEIHEFKDEILSKDEVHVKWSTKNLIMLLERAEKLNLSVIKVHNHIGSFSDFSKIDDKSDEEFFRYAHEWLGEDVPIATMLMTNCFNLKARFLDKDHIFHPVDKIRITGQMIRFNFSERFIKAIKLSAKDIRNSQALGSKTTNTMKLLKFGIVGLSGTGSLMVQQLSGCGVIDYVLVEPQETEDPNYNRIPMMMHEHIGNPTSKLELVESYLLKRNPNTKITSMKSDLIAPDAVRALSQCDILIGCMDSDYGRNVLNKIAKYYSIPYFDLGVRIDSDGCGGVDFVGASVQYMSPTSSTLLERGAISQSDIEAEMSKRFEPEIYEERLAEGYIQKSSDHSAPAVMPLNSIATGFGVLEVISRITEIKNEDMSDSEIIRFVFTESMYYGKRSTSGEAYNNKIGIGDRKLLLDMVELNETIN